LPQPIVDGRRDDRIWIAIRRCDEIGARLAWDGVAQGLAMAVALPPVKIACFRMGVASRFGLRQ
jgi:hypothetical protein